jgi:membrane protein DedA with SNARE-associated domain
MALESANIPIPSEIILPLGGYLAWRGYLAYWEAVAAGLLGSLAGSLASYLIGRWAGRPFLERYGRYLFVRRRELEAADRWFTRYGPLAVLLGRLVPGVRTFISLPAGVARMPLGQFLAYSAAGATPWTAALTWAGMAAGEQWHRAGSQLHVAALALAAAATVTITVWAWRHRGKPVPQKAQEADQEPTLTRRGQGPGDRGTRA